MFLLCLEILSLRNIIVNPALSHGLERVSRPAGRDGTGSGWDFQNGTGLCLPCSYLSYPSDIFFSVSGGKTEIFVNTFSDVITVQRIGRNALLNQVVFEAECEGSFPSTRQT